MRPSVGPKGALQAPFGPTQGPGWVFFGQKGAQEAPFCPKVGPGGGLTAVVGPLSGSWVRGLGFLWLVAGFGTRAQVSSSGTDLGWLT